MDSAAIIKALQADGWREVSQAGSHKQFKHSTKPGRVTVPHPVKDVRPATLSSIRRQSGLAIR